MPGIAGVVVLYHPDNDLFQRIDSYLPYLDELFVVDNSEVGPGPSFASGKIRYFKDGVNRGIAARLNFAAELAIAKNYDWLLTMDQDSAFSRDAMEQYMACIKCHTGSENVAVFGVQFRQPSSITASCDPVESLYLITSGSLLNLKLFPVIGHFDEALFIDLVDYDFSFRSNLKGYRTIQFNNIFLQHQLGTDTTGRSLITFKKTKRSVHAPIRIYYMVRNFLYIRPKYTKSFPAEMAHIRKDLLHRLKNNLLYNPKRFSILRHFTAGILDFTRKKMGRK
jgi:rhamnosyltransferase